MQQHAELPLLVYCNNCISRFIPFSRKVCSRFLFTFLLQIIQRAASKRRETGPENHAGIGKIRVGDTLFFDE